MERKKVALASYRGYKLFISMARILFVFFFSPAYNSRVEEKRDERILFLVEQKNVFLLSFFFFFLVFGIDSMSLYPVML